MSSLSRTFRPCTMAEHTPRLHAHHPGHPGWLCRDAGAQPGMPAHNPGCLHTSRAAAQSRAVGDASFACGWGKRSHGHQRETFPSQMVPMPGYAPSPSRASPRGQPVAEVLTSCCCWEGLAQRIAGCFARDAFAPLQTLRCPPYLCPELCERVCAYVCVRLELSGIFHAGHAFRCLQPFPTAPQARMQTCPHRSRPPRRRPPPLQQTRCHSGKFLSPLISGVVCVCPCTLCLQSLSSPLHLACFARWLKFASQ